MIERAHKSTKAVSLSTLLILILIWFCVEVPLVFLGAFFGYKCDPIEFPFEPVGDEARRLPPRRPRYKRVLIFLARAILFDIMPFGAIFVELFFILGSAWMGYYYSTFGFMLLALLVTFVTCAFTSVVITYFRLRREDYRWWWSSFTTAGLGNPLYLLSLHGTRIAGCCVYVWIRGRHGQSLVHQENVFDPSKESTKLGGTPDGIGRQEVARDDCLGNGAHCGND
eukprot:scaffold142663_cov69-Attheya_sp.AAC.3